MGNRIQKCAISEICFIAISNGEYFSILRGKNCHFMILVVISLDTCIVTCIRTLLKVTSFKQHDQDLYNSQHTVDFLLYPKDMYSKQQECSRICKKILQHKTYQTWISTG